MREKIKVFKGGWWNNLSYLVCNKKNCVIIDPIEDERIISYCRRNKLKISAILVTHDHFDHHQGNKMIKKFFKAKVYANKRALMRVDKRLEDDEVFEVAGIKIKSIYTPGHNRSAVCYLIGNNLFTGDTLFVGYVGATGVFFPGSSSEQLKNSLSRIFSMDGRIIIRPGHDIGEKQSTTIAEELKKSQHKHLNNASPFRLVKRFLRDKYGKKASFDKKV